MGEFSIRAIKMCSAIRSHAISYHSPWKWSYTQQQWSCHMGLVLLLPPVAEVPVFPSDSLPPPPSSHQSAPASPVHVLSLIWMGMSMATSNTCSMPLCPPPPPSPTTPPPPNHPIFFVQPILLSAVWFTQAWETCDHSAGYQELQAASVFGGGGREGTRKTIWHNQPTIRTFCSTLEHVDSARRDWVHLTGMT